MDTEKAFQKIGVMMESDDGRKELLQRLHGSNPSLNGNVEKALDQVNLNHEQLEKKEGFFKKMLMLPVRGIQAVGRTIKKHPVLSGIAGIAALIALLYFLPMPPGVGLFRDNLIEGGKEILRKIGVSLPSPDMDAVSAVPGTGGPVSPEVMKQAEEILQSPSNIQEEIRKLGEIIDK